ncbi:unnamed protein product [Psylliodes chrysocephalus]|uniref:Ubiquitin-like protease family profile domain-containing protein n=1 Tax=Psylliodes chrysocephalus TaxID=3402493 RepID=A0A9P0DAP4_9CUCU|nr:unnamed protein product [Psylliodes chrysocephala]
MLAQKISSENNTSHDLDNNWLCFLEKLRLTFLNDWPDRKCPGYIQQLSRYPFYLILFSGEHLDVLITKSKQNFTFMNFDATGKIVAPIPETNTPILYYALIIEGSSSNKYGQLPIAEFISAVQSTLYITIFLSTFITALKTRTGGKNIINKIEVDFCIASIQAIMKAFNDINLSSYLSNIYTWAQKSILPENILNITVIHICSVHTLRATIRKINYYRANRKLRQIAKMFVTELIHAKTLKEAEEIFEDMMIVFCSKFDGDSVRNAVKKLKQLHITLHDESDIPDPTTTNNEKTSTSYIVDDDDNTLDIESSLRHSSPFHLHFANYFENNRHNIENKSIENVNTNSLYLPEFFEYFQEYYLPFFPLWSAMVIAYFGILRESNASVEGWFKILKHHILNKQINIPVSRLVRILSNEIKPRITERKYSLITSRQRKNAQHKKHNEIIRNTDENNEFTNKNFNITNANKIIIKQHLKINKNKMKGIPWDLACESWDRSKRYFCIPKYLKDAEGLIQLEKRVRAEKILKLENLQNVKEKDSSCNKKLNVEKLEICTKKTDLKNLEKKEQITLSQNLISNLNSLRQVSCYPPSFVTKKIYLYGLYLDRTSWKTMLPNEEIDDNIINSFLILIQNIASNNNFDILCFETFLAEQILTHNHIPNGFHRWAQKVKIWTHQIWVVPVGDRSKNHWSLLIVNLRHKCLVYLDSLHLDPPTGLINQMVDFINYHTENKLNIDWTEWVLYVPKDIPTQVSKQKSTANNCGTHILTWAFLLAISSYVFFTEDDMPNIRMGIVTLLQSTDENKNRQQNIEKNRNSIFTEGKLSKSMIIDNKTCYSKFTSTRLSIHSRIFLIIKASYD